MATINVAIPFTLNMGLLNPVDNTPRDPSLPSTYVFPARGVYVVPDDVASHWYTASHLAGYEPAVEGETVVLEPEPIDPIDPDPVDPESPIDALARQQRNQDRNQMDANRQQQHDQQEQTRQDHARRTGRQQPPE